jgi:excinuclease UvrABC nuclease subunit
MKLINCIYRFLNDSNEIIYIGKSKNLKHRLQEHNHLPKECYKECRKIEYTMFNTEYDMDLAERYYIPKFKPKYNDLMKFREVTLSIDIFDNVKWNTLNKHNKNKVKKPINQYNHIYKLNDEQLYLEFCKYINKSNNKNKNLGELIRGFVNH